MHLHFVGGSLCRQRTRQFFNSKSKEMTLTFIRNGIQSTDSNDCVGRSLIYNESIKLRVLHDSVKYFLLASLYDLFPGMYLETAQHIFSNQIMAMSRFFLALVGLFCRVTYCRLYVYRLKHTLFILWFPWKCREPVKFLRSAFSRLEAVLFLSTYPINF